MSFEQQPDKDDLNVRSWKELARAASSTEMHKELLRWGSGTSSWKEQQRWHAADVTVGRLTNQLSSTKLVEVECDADAPPALEGAASQRQQPAGPAVASSWYVGKYAAKYVGSSINAFTNLFRVQYRVLMVGLDGSGSTTALHALLHRQHDDASASRVNVETLTYRHAVLSVRDCSGQAALRPLWRYYYEGTSLVVFVVDATDRERISSQSITSDSAEAALHEMAADPLLAGVPVLVLANKQDVAGAMTTAEVEAALRLKKLDTRLWRAQGCCAITGAGLHAGLDWGLWALAGSRVPPPECHAVVGEPPITPPALAAKPAAADSAPAAPRETSDGEARWSPPREPADEPNGSDRRSRRRSSVTSRLSSRLPQLSRGSRTSNASRRASNVSLYEAPRRSSHHHECLGEIQASGAKLQSTAI